MNSTVTDTGSGGSMSLSTILGSVGVALSGALLMALGAKFVAAKWFPKEKVTVTKRAEVCVECNAAITPPETVCPECGTDVPEITTTELKAKKIEDVIPVDRLKKMLPAGSLSDNLKALATDPKKFARHVSMSAAKQAKEIANDPKKAMEEFKRYHSSIRSVDDLDNEPVSAPRAKSPTRSAPPSRAGSALRGASAKRLQIVEPDDEYDEEDALTARNAVRFNPSEASCASEGALPTSRSRVSVKVVEQEDDLDMEENTVVATRKPKRVSLPPVEPVEDNIAEPEKPSAPTPAPVPTPAPAPAPAPATHASSVPRVASTLSSALAVAQAAQRGTATPMRRRAAAEAVATAPPVRTTIEVDVNDIETIKKILAERKAQA